MKIPTVSKKKNSGRKNYLKVENWKWKKNGAKRFAQGETE